MKALILAGGKGTRLQSVLSDIPKPMAPIAGKPFLEYLLLQLKSFSVNDVLLSVGYKKESVISYFSNGAKWDINITYVSENVPLGTGGAIQEALRLIDDKYLLVLNGDSYIDVDFSRYIQWHLQKECSASIVITKMDNTNRYGTIGFEGEDKINKFIEKEEENGPGWINAGVYLFHRSVFKNKSPGEFCSLEKDVLPILFEKGLYGYRCDGAFIDIGTPESYSRAADFFSMIRK